jgi:ribonuclease T1
MTNIATRIAKSLLAVLLALVGAYGVAAPAAAAPAPAAVAPAVAPAQASCGDTAGFTEVALSSLPTQATDTVNLIESGGPFPYPEDGEVFQNREGILPACATGYYHEYTVVTPGSSTRGTRRIITGEGGEYFYTDDHYASFVLVDVNS